MRRTLLLAALAFVTSVAPALSAPPTVSPALSPTDALTQAQSQLTTNPDTAAQTLQQAAAVAGNLPAVDAVRAATVINTFAAWASNPAHQTANPAACSSIFTSLLTLASTPVITAAYPDLYASVLVAAQEFVDNTPPDALKKVAALSGYLQLAIGAVVPPNPPALPIAPSAD